MGIICAYQFTIHPTPGQTTRACLDAVRDEVAGWVCGIYTQVGCHGVSIPFDGSCLTPHPAHELWSDQQDCDTHRLATLEWVSLVNNHDLTLYFLLAFTAACDEQSVEVALLLHTVSRPFILQPVNYSLPPGNPFTHLPGLALRIIRAWPCEEAGQCIPIRARVLRVNSLDEFVRERLLVPTRVLPIIACNVEGPFPFRGNSLQRLQDLLLGHAEVVALANPSTAARLATLLGPDRVGVSAVLRIYWPGCTADVSTLRYGLFHAQQLQTALAGDSIGQFLIRQLFAVTAARYREGELIRAARRALSRDRSEWRRAAAEAAAVAALATAEARQAREEHDRLRQEADTARSIVRSLQADLAEREALSAAAKVQAEGLDGLAVELERSWDENRRLADQVEAARRRVADLEAELRIHQNNWALLGAGHATAAGTEQERAAREREFASVAEALQSAGEAFADVLVVWDDAVKAAALSPYALPAKVFQALEAIAEVARAFFEARDGGPPLGPVERAFAARVPFKYTGFESQTTLSQYGEQRVFHHHEQKRQMQRHLTLGGGTTNNCLQIYFDFDDATRRVLIGYCGRHLPYYRQRS